ncbi:major histocompatibility complex class I-related gene protein-like [Rhinophrynus dorsalis]
MFGCELRDDGSIQGYDQHGYDGRDFISLDRERGIFVPTMDEARLTAQRLNSPELNVQEHMRNFLDKICVDRLKKYINYGREEMERRVVPGVKVSHRQSDGVTKLHCRVYGFYPRTVDVKWVKNGRDDVYSEEAKQILPNPDGTYQTRVTVEVDPKEGDSYSCHVDHSSLNSTLIVAWDPKKDRGFWHIVIGAVAAVTVIVGLIGLFMWKKRTDYALTTSSDSDSSPASQAI